MTYRHIGASFRQARRVGGPVGVALERSTEAAAKEAAHHALELALDALRLADLDDVGGAMHLLAWAGTEAAQAVEVGWSWVLPKRAA